MGRRVRDIINILMQIEMNFSKLYMNISELDGKYSIKLKTIAAILSKEEMIHYEWYKNLLGNNNLLDILLNEDFYEKASSNLKAFKSSISRTAFYRENDIIKTAYEYELINVDTLQDILNLINQAKEKEENEGNDLIGLLKELIRIEEKHAENLKTFIKG